MATAKKNVADKESAITDKLDNQKNPQKNPFQTAVKPAVLKKSVGNIKSELPGQKKTVSVKKIKSSTPKNVPIQIELQSKIESNPKMPESNLPVLKKETKKNISSLARIPDFAKKSPTLSASKSKNSISSLKSKDKMVVVKKSTTRATVAGTSKPTAVSVSAVLEPAAGIVSVPNSTLATTKPSIPAKTIISKAGAWPFPVGIKP